MKKIKQCEFDEEVIYQEILPRLPIKSVFRSKLVCKKWLNLITNDPLFNAHYSQKCPNITASSFFCNTSKIFISSDDDDDYHIFNHSALLPDGFNISGSANGLIYGVCSKFTQIFICNPITKHTVYIPNTSFVSSFALVWDPYNPNSGFTIVSATEDVYREEEDYSAYALFKVYSSKTGKWQDSPEFMVHNDCYFKRCPVYTGGKAYWSLGFDVLLFDIEKDVADLIRFPASDNTHYNHHLLDSSYTEIGVCDGEVSYSKLTKEADLEIWLLRGKNDEFEWVKKHTVSLQRIIDMNCDVMSNECENVPGMQQKTAAKDLVKHRVVKPLPFSGGEAVWFSISDWNDKFQRVFTFNLRTQELKLTCDNFRKGLPMCPFVPTLLPCPT
ncbi:hypothetical protein Sjap_017295 [Stephania japonica]|uniref:F-box domain-containing protein n=1 Tax=Stephania japonica TaxID=461633 RepID=A0AAP0I5X0_9MAGN